MKDQVAALKSFERARDYDAFAARADTRINRVITEAVQPGAALGVDAVQKCSSHTPDGVPGKELFYEHVHFTMAGNELLARLLAAKVAGQLPASITAHGGEQPVEIEAEACKRRLAATVWDQKRVWDVALGRISGAPFTSQSSHPRNLQYCKDRMKEVDARTAPQSPKAGFPSPRRLPSLQPPQPPRIPNLCKYMQFVVAERLIAT